MPADVKVKRLWPERLLTASVPMHVDASGDYAVHAVDLMKKKLDEWLLRHLRENAHEDLIRELGLS